MKYISHGRNYNTIKTHVNAPIFKRVFDCDGSANATLTISAAGLYRLFLNGEELNRSLFAPTLSNPDQVVFEDKYDVSGRRRRSACLRGLVDAYSRARLPFSRGGSRL